MNSLSDDSCSTKHPAIKRGTIKQVDTVSTPSRIKNYHKHSNLEVLALEQVCWICHIMISLRTLVFFSVCSTTGSPPPLSSFARLLKVSG